MTMTPTLVHATEPACWPGQILGESHRLCEQITRRAARNFYYGLKLLPEPKRSQMYALYAYMRLLDDIADEDDGRSVQRREDDLQVWRDRTHQVLSHQDSPRAADPLSRRAAPGGEETTIWPAFADMVHRRRVPGHLFDSAIAGQRRDLRPPAFNSFDSLHEYCYQVAGVVGIASVCVWGYEGGDDTLDLAAKRGVALQLTNILRDLREDAAGGRTYLPADELASANVSPEQFRHGRGGKEFLDLIRFQIDRAESYYRASAALEARVEPDSRPTLVAMTSIYRGLLKRIAKEPERVLRQRVSLSLFHKLWIASRASRASRAARAAVP